MKISDEMIEQIKVFEGCHQQAYLDASGMPTIGINHTGKDVTIGDKISASEASRLFRRDVLPYENAVNELHGKLMERTRGLGGFTQRQFDALVSLVYNVGIGAIRKESVFYKILMSGGRNNYPSICHAFMTWSKTTDYNGAKITNIKLSKRRAKEAAWYVYGFNYEAELQNHGIKDILSWARS